MRPGTWERRLIPLLTLILAIGASAASPLEVPLPLQAVLFKKIFQYDRALEGRSEVRVLIVFEEEGAEEVDEATAAFRRVGLLASSVKASRLTETPDTDAVYLMPSALHSPSRRWLVRGGILTLAGSGHPAEGGLAAIGLERRQDGRPQIVVHMAELHREKHELSAELLRLARVIPESPAK